MQYTEKQLEKAAFYGLCKHYDFLHEYSDDHKAWKKGEAQWKSISDAVLADETLQPILKAWAEYWRDYIERKPAIEPDFSQFI